MISVVLAAAFACGTGVGGRVGAVMGGRDGGGGAGSQVDDPESGAGAGGGGGEATDGMAFGGGKFLVARGSNLASSSDGLSWTKAAPASSFGPATM